MNGGGVAGSRIAAAEDRTVAHEFEARSRRNIKDRSEGFLSAHDLVGAKSSSLVARRSAVVSSRRVIGISPYCAVSFRFSNSINALAARSPPGTIWRSRAAASR